MRPPRAWVFDLDGTLTVAQHDFAAIKRELGLPPESPVLEGIAAAPAADRARLLDAVHRWELDLAAHARPNPGAAELLARLRARGLPLGVLTRNTSAIAWRTLEVTRLAWAFARADVLGREDTSPKPAPDGVLALASRWGVPPAELVVVGDFRFDLDAARAAGAQAVWLDSDGTGEFASLADRVVRGLAELADLAAGP